MIKMKIKIKKLKIEEIMMLIFPIAYFIRFISNWDIRITSMIWFLAAGILLFSIARQDKNIIIHMLPFFIIDIFAIWSLSINKTHDIWYIGVLLAPQIWGMYIFKNKNRLRALSIVSIIIILYLSVRVFREPLVLINSWQYGIILSNLVRQNTVSIFLVEFLIYHILHRYNQGLEIKYWPIIVGLCAALRCNGAGGILTLSCMFLGVLLIKKKDNRFSKIKLFFFFSFLVVLIAISRGYQDIIMNFMDDNGRWYIWSNYVVRTDTLGEVFFGTNVSDHNFLKTSNNMHNTILNMHYCFGLFSMIFLISTLLKTIFIIIKRKQHLFAIILGVTLLRAMTDEAYFAFGAIWVYFYLETSLNSSKNVDMGRQQKNFTLSKV